MSDEAPDEDEEKSFRERVEEIRQEQEAGEGERPPGGGMGEMMGGGGMGGGNPFAQMMGGMMGGGGGGGGDIETERLVRELGQLREEVRETTTQLERIADALEDD